MGRGIFFREEGVDGGGEGESFFRSTEKKSWR